MQAPGVELLVSDELQGGYKCYGTVEAKDSTDTNCVIGIPYCETNIPKYNPITNQTDDLLH